MKILKAVTATLVGYYANSSASAQTVIHITGSTAYRTAVYYAINDILQPGFVFGYSGTGAKSESGDFHWNYQNNKLPGHHQNIVLWFGWRHLRASGGADHRTWWHVYRWRRLVG